MLPGGVEGVIAHVEISGDQIYRDVFDIVRLPAPIDVVLPTVENQGPLRGALKAVGGHRTADVPFRMGKARKVNLPGVHRRHKARVARRDDPAAIEAVFNPGFVGWLAATNPPFCFELFAGWMTVFHLEHRPEPEEGLYPALGDAATRFAGACRGLPGAH